VPFSQNFVFTTRKALSTLCSFEISYSWDTLLFRLLVVISLNAISSFLEATSTYFLVTSVSFYLSKLSLLVISPSFSLSKLSFLLRISVVGVPARLFFNCYILLSMAFNLMPCNSNCFFIASLCFSSLLYLTSNLVNFEMFKSIALWKSSFLSLRGTLLKFIYTWVFMVIKSLYPSYESWATAISKIVLFKSKKI